MIMDLQFGIAMSGVHTALLELRDIRHGQHSSSCRWLQVNDTDNSVRCNKLSCGLQAAELLFGSAGRPHDYLQEALFRLLAVGFVGAASQNWILKVQHVMVPHCISHTKISFLHSPLLVLGEDKHYLTNTPTRHTCLSAKSRFA